MHRIVVIEDNSGDVLLLRLALDERNEPYELEVLKDGEDAIRFIDEHERGKRTPEPCVFVIDLHLPKFDGLTVLRTLKESPRLAHIHTVVLTSSASPREEAEVLALGVRLYKTKPLLLEEFLKLGAEIIAICKDQQTRYAGV